MFSPPFPCSLPHFSSLLQRYNMQTGNQPNGVGYKMEMHTHILLLIISITKTHLYACIAIWGMVIPQQLSTGSVGEFLISAVECVVGDLLPRKQGHLTEEAEK